MGRAFPIVAALICFAIFSSCATTPNRKPAQDVRDLQNDVRVATRVIGGSKQEPYQWVIIGIKKSGREPGSYVADLHTLGFEGEDIDRVDPMFLVKVTKDGVRDLRSFELGDFPVWSMDFKITDHPLYKNPEWRRRFDALLHPERRAELPADFMDVPFSKLMLLSSAATDFLIGSLTMGSFELAPAAAALGYVRKQIQYRLEQEADALRTFIDIEKENPGSFPGLRKALSFGCTSDCSEGRMNEIGGSIAYRYNQYDPFYSLLLKPSDDIPAFYEASRKSHLTRARDNMDALHRFVTMLGPEYQIIPVGERYVFVFVDGEVVKAKAERAKTNRDREFDSKIIETDDPQKILDFYKSVNLKKGRYIPLCFISLDWGTAPTQLIDFNVPGKINSQQRTLAVYMALKEMGLNVAPTLQLNLAFRVVDFGTSFVARKQGKTYMDFRFRPNAQARAILESGAVGFDPKEVSIEAFLQIMDLWGVDPNTVAYYAGRFKSMNGNQNMTEKVMSEAIGIPAEKISTLTEVHKEGLQERNPEAVSRELEKMVLEMLNMESNLQSVFNAPAYEQRRTNKRVNFLRFQKWLESKWNTAKTEKPQPKRYLASEAKPRPVILFLLDGVRPDRLAREGEICMTGSGPCLIPTITEYFLKHGNQLNSFTSRSLTLPSWTTVLTGYEPDEHGIQSNTPLNRSFGDDKRLRSESFLDVRPDLFAPKYLAQGRSVRKLDQVRINWLAKGFYDKKEFLYNFMPLTDNAYPPVLRLIGSSLIHIPDIATGVMSWAALYDRENAKDTAAEIRSRRGKENQYKVILNWYASMDAYLHHRADAVDDAWKALDDSVKIVIDEAQKDPSLKDAVMFAVSDHGHLGGPSYGGPQDDLLKDEPYFINNTSFNLAEFFAGDFQGYANYPFVVYSSESPEPNYDLTYLHELMIHPFSYTYRGRAKREGPRTLMVDFSGDNLAQVYVKNPVKGWSERLNFYELSHYPAGRDIIDIPTDLMTFQVPENQVNIAESNWKKTNRVKEKLKAVTGFRPVRMFAMPLTGDRARESINKLAPSRIEISREPVLVRAFQPPDKYLNAIILVHSDSVNSSSASDTFRYLVVKNFNQLADGTVTGQVVKDPSLDPLGYLNSVVIAKNNGSWYTDRQWLEAAQGHAYPTAVFTLPRILTLSPRAQNPRLVDEVASQNMRGAIADFIVISNRGFNFNSGFHTQSDHGGITRDEMMTAVIQSGLGASQPTGYRKVNYPILNRDVAATVLDFAGKYAPEDMPGRSFRNAIE